MTAIIQGRRSVWEYLSQGAVGGTRGGWEERGRMLVGCRDQHGPTWGEVPPGPVPGQWHWGWRS